MTFAQQLRKEGMEKGLQQGMQKGRQEGEKEASLKIARQMIAIGVERGIVKLSTGLSDAELDNLSH